MYVFAYFRAFISIRRLHVDRLEKVTNKINNKSKNKSIQITVLPFCLWWFALTVASLVTYELSRFTKSTENL